MEEQRSRAAQWWYEVSVEVAGTVIAAAVLAGLAMLFGVIAYNTRLTVAIGFLLVFGLLQRAQYVQFRRNWGAVRGRRLYLTMVLLAVLLMFFTDGIPEWAELMR